VPPVPLLSLPPPRLFILLLLLFLLSGQLRDRRHLDRHFVRVSNRDKIRICILRWQAQGDQSRVLLCFLDQANLVFALLGCCHGVDAVIAFSVPVEVFALLPAAYGRHERVTQVVLALGIVFDILPFEVAAAATVYWLVFMLWQ
jgi:hypothetical protein